MSSVNWQELLGWNLEQIEEVRLAGFSFLKEGRYEQALIFFEALIILDPYQLYDKQTLGAIYLQMGESEKALHFLDQVLEKEPANGATLLNKTKALLMLNRKQEALEIARRLSTFPQPEIANDATALLLAYR